MPTLFVFFGFLFLFYSNDHEPVHVHIVKDNCEAKYNVEPIQLIYNHGFKEKQLVIIESVIKDNAAIIKDMWKNYFKSKK